MVTIEAYIKKLFIPNPFPTWGPKALSLFSCPPVYPHTNPVKQVKLKVYDLPKEQASMAEWRFEPGCLRSEWHSNHYTTVVGLDPIHSQCLTELATEMGIRCPSYIFLGSSAGKLADGQILCRTRICDGIRPLASCWWTRTFGEWRTL